MDMKQVLAELRKPFPPEYIEWVVQRKTNTGDKAWVSANVDPRHYMDRLNEVVGGDWSAVYTAMTEDWTVVRCDLTILGVTRCDFSEQAKGSPNILTQSLSQSFKRANVNFGLGTDLYFLPQNLVPINEYGQIQAKPDLPAWYYEKCGLPIAGGKPAIVAKAEAVMNGAPDDFDNLHQDENLSEQQKNPVIPTFAELIKDDTYRKSWWADVKKLGYTTDDVHKRLGVASTKDITLTAAQVWEKLASFCPVHNVDNRRHEKDGKVWYSHKEGDKWCNGGVVK